MMTTGTKLINAAKRSGRGCCLVFAAGVSLALASSPASAAAFTWMQLLRTDAGESSSAVATDHDGNVIIAGQTSGALAGVNAGLTDAWLAKFDRNGDVLWKVQFGTPWFDFAYGVAADVANNILVCGYSEQSFRAWIAKYSPKGTLRWKRDLDEDTVCRGVATDASGNILMAGLIHGRGADGFAAKYDAGGNRKWAFRSGSEMDDYFSGVATDGNGDVIAVGTTGGSIARKPRGPEDAWLIKLDGGGGTMIWQHQVGSAALDEANAVATDASGNIFVSGATLGSFGGSNRGSGDAWLAKYGRDGNQLWQRQLGSDEYDAAWGVATDSDGNAVMAGHTFGAIVKGQRIGSHDAWAAKYSRDGRPLWRAQFGVVGSYMSAAGVAIDAEGGIFITGETNSDAFIAELARK